ncbi:nicotinate-nucleotide--dimethylbenzimidazole phosphoribosyltransferase [Amorphus orientalis]|uniref:Nicotinate-nucleotide--dimethylbenzimidazole phosphoribosyltransferase n=1 Tax=Amorphus orientalis TaxID=649198 RepID=A0AAE4AVS9_9HYPH|nr:nicotinate-nucleotide--dimethylbenzimidazole phosphoribosyltransferase [Amorphus orientalis]MDQ0316994.1 nicotinate-nucleotide--dimethylbenzimidazole phosphoribosyltransferase [Amorphus orientalis]
MSDPTAPRPFDDIRALVTSRPAPDADAIAATRAREQDLTKPAGSLGRLEEIAAFVAGWQGKAPPEVSSPTVAVFAANHGVADQGVSAFPASVTKQMVENFRKGGAAINQICLTNDLALRVFELALERPTGDILLTDAFDSERECAATIAYGMEAIAGEVDLLCLGEMGIANTAIAAAVLHALYGGTADEWVGRGTGVSDEGLAHKADVVGRAVARLDGERDPLVVLQRVGGREIAAMVGAILAARQQRIPVVVDGFVTTAAAAVVHAIEPDAIAHCLFGHVSAEKAHRAALERLGADPLLDLGMRLGEGTGAALAAGLIRAAIQTHRGMSTFSDAGVAGPGGE